MFVEKKSIMRWMEHEVIVRSLGLKGISFIFASTDYIKYFMYNSFSISLMLLTTVDDRNEKKLNIFYLDFFIFAI